MRASDAERERAVEALGKHHADGRLTIEEFEERTGRAHAATTREELDELFGDLPRPRLPERRHRPWRPRPLAPLFAFPLIVLVFAAAVLTSAHAAFFVWPLLFFLFFRFAFMRRRWWGPPGRWPEPYRRY